MSMDEQYEQMQRFLNALTLFNERLKGTMTDLEKCHDVVSPHWQDTMRQQYDAEWIPLDETMKRYVWTEGPSYVEFLNIKLYALGQYLNGR